MSEIARAHGLRRVVRATLGRAYPRIIGANRERSWLFYDTILPLLGTIAFVYKALGAPDRFVGYVIMGGATMAFWMNVMWNMAAQFYWDKQGGNLELYMVVPCGIVPILLGMSFGGFVGTMVRVVAIITIGSLLFGITYTISQLPLFLLVFAVAIIALYGMGVTFASLFLLWAAKPGTWPNCSWSRCSWVRGSTSPCGRWDSGRRWEPPSSP